MNLSFVGKSADIELLRQRASAAGHTLDDGTPGALFEFHLSDKSAKRAAIAATTAGLVFTTAVPCSATEAASWAQHPENVIGISPVFNNVVEAARPLQSHLQTFERGKQLLEGMGLEVIAVADSVALVRMRVLCCLVNEAVSALAEGVATAEAIDTAMKLGTNYPRGPLNWGDTLGAEVVLAVLRGLQEETGEDRYRPSPLLVRKVQAGLKLTD